MNENHRRPSAQRTESNALEVLAALADLSAEAAPARRLKITRAIDVAAVSVKWLWPSWLPFGKLVSFDGAPGIGKSTLAIDLIARASRGGPMPAESETLDPVTVLIAGVEDGWADTVRPRLDAADADLSRIHFVEAAAAGGGCVTVPNDVLELAAVARKLGARWLHIDAMMGTLSEGVNAYSDHEVRRALGPVKAMAESLEMLVTFIRHPRKTGGSGVNAGGGSVAFGALSRMGLFAGFDPNDAATDPNERRRVLAVAKSNLARMPAALCYSVVSAANGQACIEWGERSHLSADDLAAPINAPARTPTGEAPRAKQRNAAESLVEALLIDGARLTVDAMKAHARKHDVSWRTMQRAAQNVGVCTHRTGYGKPAEWYLPTVSDDAVAPVAPRDPSNAEHGASGATESQSAQLMLETSATFAPNAPKNKAA